MDNQTPVPIGNPEGEKNGVLVKLLKEFFKHKIVVKMYHFQTSSYGAHKATDAYLLKFDANFDRFMEVAQGISQFGGSNRKLSLDSIDLGDIKLVKDDPNDTTANLINSVEKFIIMVDNNVKYEKPEYHGLAAIRDEIIADAQQFVYLLKFK